MAGFQNNYRAILDFLRPQDVTFGNPLTCDCSESVNHIATLSGNTTVNLTSLTAGMSGVITLTNNGVGGYTLGFGAAFTSLQNGSDTYDNTAAAVNIIEWSYDGTDVYYRLINIL